MKLWRRAVVVVVAVCGMAMAGVAPVSAATAIPAPPTSSPVLDQANVLQDTTEATLSQTILDYEKTTGNQIAVLTITDLGGEAIEGYAYRVASSWGVGNQKANNGVLLVVAIQDRRVRIEVGRNLEPMLTDLQTHRIIQDYIVPQFRAGDYNAGVTVGVQKIIAVIGGERLSGAAPTTSRRLKVSEIFDLAYLAITAISFVISYIGAFLGRTKSWWLGGVLGVIPGAVMLFFASVIFASIFILAGGLIGFILDFIASKNYRERKSRGEDTTWWGSGGGFFGSSGGSGGGGFDGFGGGSFGGGGASGSW